MSSARVHLCKLVSQLWFHLFRQDNAVVRAHVLQTFRAFASKTSLASGGVNVAEQSVPPECKAQLASILLAHSHTHLNCGVASSVWSGATSAARATRPAARYRNLGAVVVGMAVDRTGEMDGGSEEADGRSCVRLTAIERDCAAMELLLPRVEAAVLQHRPAPQVTARLLALTDHLARIRSSLIAT